MKWIRRYSIPIFLLFAAGILFAPGLAALLFSALCALIALEMRRTLHSLREGGVEAIARIERIERDSDGDMIPVMAFETAEGARVLGRPVCFTNISFGYGSTRKRDAAQELTVRYQPDNPEKFVVMDEEGNARIALNILRVLTVLIAVAGAAQLLGYIEIETSRPEF